MKLFYFILLFSFATEAFSQDSLIFIIRVDDIMSRNTTVQPRSIQPFENMAAQRGAKITWVVIPHRLIEAENKNGELRQELLQSLQNGHEVSQHGYNHYCPVDNSWNHEMYCSGQQVSFTAAYQESLIVAGKKILQDSLGIQPVSFVPPGHSADTTTYRLLQESGFSWISTSEPTKTFIHPGLYNLKPHAEFTWALQPAQYQSRLEQALTSVRTQGEADGYYCLLLHDYFIRSGYENGIVIQWTGELLDSLISYYGNRLKFQTLENAAQHFSGQVVHLQQDPHYVPQLVTLHQNYPNPFNPGTTISFELSTASEVSLQIFNVLGEEVTILLSGFLQSGSHSVDWIPSAGMVGGVYFYRLQAQGFSDFRKMILLR